MAKFKVPILIEVPALVEVEADSEKKQLKLYKIWLIDTSMTT